MQLNWLIPTKAAEMSGGVEKRTAQRVASYAAIEDGSQKVRL